MKRTGNCDLQISSSFIGHYLGLCQPPCYGRCSCTARLGRNTEEIMEMFVEKYLAAQTRFQRAEEVLSGIAEKIEFAHWTLSQNPPKAVFSGGPGLPADA